MNKNSAISVEDASILVIFQNILILVQIFLNIDDGFLNIVFLLYIFNRTGAIGRMLKRGMQLWSPRLRTIHLH